MYQTHHQQTWHAALHHEAGRPIAMKTINISYPGQKTWRIRTLTMKTWMRTANPNRNLPYPGQKMQAWCFRTLTMKTWMTTANGDITANPNRNLPHASNALRGVDIHPPHLHPPPTTRHYFRGPLQPFLHRSCQTSRSKVVDDACLRCPLSRTSAARRGRNARPRRVWGGRR